MEFKMGKEGFKSFLKVGTICFFKNPYFPSKHLHPHVCVFMSDKDALFMICATSQFDTKRKHFEYNGIANETLVRVIPSNLNSLKKDTYIDCNEPEPYSLENLSQLFNDSKLELYGEISESELLQIKMGIEMSDLIEGEVKEEIINSFPNNY